MRLDTAVETDLYGATRRQLSVRVGCFFITNVDLKHELRETCFVLNAAGIYSVHSSLFRGMVSVLDGDMTHDVKISRISCTENTVLF